MKSHITKRGKIYWYVRGSRSKRFRTSLNTKNKTIALERKRMLDNEFWMEENTPETMVRHIMAEKGVSLNQLLDGLRSGGLRQGSDITLQVASEVFFSELTFEKEATKKHNLKRIQKVVDHIGKDLMISDIDEGHINILMKKLKEVDGYSPSTRKNHQTMANKMFRHFAKRYGIVDPTVDVKSVKVVQKVKRAIPGDLLFETIDNNTPELYVELSELHKGSGVYFKPEHARKDKLFWTLIAFTGMNVIDAYQVKKEDFTQANYREKSGELRILVLVDQLAKYGDEIFDIFTYDQAKKSSRRFSKITGWNLKSVRKWYANKIVPILPERDVKPLMGHSANSKALNTSYLLADRDKISEKMQTAFNDVMPVKAQA